jgi:hypothetical protein
VTAGAERIALLPQHRDVVAAVRIVTREAGHAARVHEALDEVVALHPILMRRPVREMGEGQFSCLVRLQVCEAASQVPNS